MKQIINRLIFTALAAVVLLVAGCSKEPQTEGDTDGTYLSLSIDGVKAATSAKSTRATAVDEGAITDVWVLQFEMTAGSTTEGTLVAKSYIATVTEPTKIPFGFAKGDNMAVYLVANSGDDALFNSTAVGTTLAAVKEQSVSATTTAGGNFPTETSANLPMVGQSGAMTFPAAAVPVTLTRVVSKIVLTIKNPLATGYPLLTVASVQLKNAPKAYRAQAIDDPSGFDGSTDAKRSPAASADNFRNYTAVAGNITAAGTTSTYYLAPNVRGISTNTDNRLKSDATALVGQGDFCTYVEIMGTAKSSATAPAVDVRYRLYLGANNTNDFNLEANTAYKVDIELTGINVNDARMTIATDRFDLIEGDTDGDHSEDIGGFAPPPPVVGGYYYSDGSYSTDLDASKKATGLIYWIDPADSQIYKVMSLEGFYSTLTWAASNYYVVSGARSDTDGKANSVAIKKAFDDNSAGAIITQTDFAAAFPAAAYCYNYTGKENTDAKGSWHLPAKSELQYLWCDYNGVPPTIWGDYPALAPTSVPAEQDKWNNLIKAGGVADGMSNDYLWSSTEYSTNTSHAWYVDFNNGDTHNDDKDYYWSVRCVRDIAPPPPAVGDYYYSDGSYSTDFKTGKTATGLIYWIDPADSKKYKVMSLEGTIKQWAADQAYVVSGARNNSDGKVNFDAVKAYFDANTVTVGSDFAVAFPAFDHCYNYTGKAGTDAKGTWYLPAKYELQYLWCAYNDVPPISWSEIGSNSGAPGVTAKQQLWNDRIIAGGSSDVINSAGGGGSSGGIGSYVWSSTDDDNPYNYNCNACNLDFSDGGRYSAGRNTGYYIRCIRNL